MCSGAYTWLRVEDNWQLLFRWRWRRRPVASKEDVLRPESKVSKVDAKMNKIKKMGKVENGKQAG